MTSAKGVGVAVALCMVVLSPGSAGADTLRVLVRVSDGAVLQWSVTEPSATVATHIAQAAHGFGISAGDLSAHDVTATANDIAAVRAALAKGGPVTVPGLSGARAVLTPPPPPAGPPTFADRLDQAITIEDLKRLLKERLR